MKAPYHRQKNANNIAGTKRQKTFLAKKGIKKMKKILAFMLAMLMMFSFAACSNNEQPEDETENIAENEVTVNVGSALEILENTWALFGDSEKFSTMGGDYDAMISDAPGEAVSSDYLTSVLLVPEAELANVSEAASLVHAMMLNNFTCGAFKVTDAAAFAEIMHETIASSNWLCGMPDKMVIATIGNEYVVAMFGINDAVNPFEAKLTEAYPEASVLYSEAIA